jgi:hypothetical protein
MMMETILQQKMAEVTKGYDMYIQESEQDLKDADKEINALEEVLEVERIKTDTLQKTKDHQEIKIKELS